MGAYPCCRLALSLGVAGPGADNAFLTAEFVALLCRGVQRTRNFRLHGIAVGTARIGHVDRKRGAGALHGERGANALALLQRRGARSGLGGIVIGLAIGAALADGEGAGRPCPGDEARDAQYQRQRKDKERAALCRDGRNDQNPLPRGNGQNLAGGSFNLVNYPEAAPFEIGSTDKWARTTTRPRARRACNPQAHLVIVRSYF